ncbi:YdcF family protein [Shewanella sp. YIC-542]|uniref:YdcF family protein n=1 Tax=Shewanella mytili TaxID=3377111 RepID=UPI00398E376C
MPVPLSLLLLALALWYWQRRPKLAKGLVLGVMSGWLFLSSSFGSFWLVWPLEQQYPVSRDIPPHSCVVMVLGSGHDDALTGDARHKLSATALARLTEGVAQMKRAASRDCLLAVSGWSGGLNSTSHAQQMHDAAIALGADADRILVLPSPRDTIEEALMLRRAFGADADDKGADAIGGRQLLLVTSATHMPRAMKIFQMAQLAPVAAPTDFLARRDHWWRLSTANLDASAKAIHEYVGMTWLNIRIMLGF